MSDNSSTNSANYVNENENKQQESDSVFQMTENYGKWVSNGDTQHPSFQNQNSHEDPDMNKVHDQRDLESTNNSEDKQSENVDFDMSDNSEDELLDENSITKISSSDEINNSSSDRSKEGTKRKHSSKLSTDITTKEKNREHAKNTRIRKKNYIESLKENIKFLTAEREKLDHDRKMALSKLAEQAMIRKKVLQTMFYYRATNELDPDKWSTILEENYTMVMPITPYRSFPSSEVIDSQRHIKGIHETILDTASLNLMLQSIGTPQDDSGKIIVQYFSGANESVVADNTFMCKWHMITLNAVQRGAKYEITKQGMIKAVFSNQNKLLHVEFTFDVMSFMQQLRRASRRSEFLVIPNNQQLAEEESMEARVITEATPPYRITYVNKKWTEVFGYTSNQAIGKTCKFLQGLDTEQDRLVELMARVRRNLPAMAILSNYTQNKTKIRNWVRIFPLYAKNRVSHFLGIMEKVVEVPLMQYMTNNSLMQLETGLNMYDKVLHDNYKLVNANSFNNDRSRADLGMNPPLNIGMNQNILYSQSDHMKGPFNNNIFKKSELLSWKLDTSPNHPSNGNNFDNMMYKSIKIENNSNESNIPTPIGGFQTNMEIHNSDTNKVYYQFNPAKNTAVLIPSNKYNNNSNSNNNSNNNGIRNSKVAAGTWFSGESFNLQGASIPLDINVLGNTSITNFENERIVADPNNLPSHWNTHTDYNLHMNDFTQTNPPFNSNLNSYPIFSNDNFNDWTSQSEVQLMRSNNIQNNMNVNHINSGISNNNNLNSNNNTNSNLIINNSKSNFQPNQNQNNLYDNLDITFPGDSMEASDDFFEKDLLEFDQ
eukprot:gene6499-8934_t